MNRTRKIARLYTVTCKPTRPQFTPNWSTFTRDQLRQACKTRGIVYGRMTKAQMVQALSAL